MRAVIGPGETPPWAAEDSLQIVEASFSDASAIQQTADSANAYFLMSPPSERQVEWRRTQITAAVKAEVERAS